MVRATLMTLVMARMLSDKRFTAETMRDLVRPSMRQTSSIMSEGILAFVKPRRCWSSRAASTLALILSERRSPDLEKTSPAGTGSIQMCMSMRSSRGPDIRDRYLEIITGVQVHGLSGWPKNPQGHGFMAATSWNSAGKLIVLFARDILTTWSSMG